jgi:ADP-ribose pyrophosphatase YjhB (NUDIX family)
MRRSLLHRLQAAERLRFSSPQSDYSGLFRCIGCFYGEKVPLPLRKRQSKHLFRCVGTTTEQAEPQPVRSDAHPSFRSSAIQLPLAEVWPRLQQQYSSIQNSDGMLDLYAKPRSTTTAPLKSTAMKTSRPPSVGVKATTTATTTIPRMTSGNLDVSSLSASHTKAAAVLVLLVLLDGGREPALVFTRRSASLSKHAAEISFPGGHVEEKDASLVDTALREAFEELYPPLMNETATATTGGTESHDPTQQVLYQAFIQRLRILGCGTAVPSIHGISVTPVLALLDTSESTNPNSTQDYLSLWQGNPAEVDHVFTVSLAELLDCEATQALPPTSRFPHTIKNAPVFPTQQHGTIWGLTAFILRPILHQLYRPVFFPS